MTNTIPPFTPPPPAPRDKVAVTKTFAGIAVLVAAFAASHQSAVITLVAMLVVWAINVTFKYFNKQIGTAWLTTILYVLAVVLALVFSPVALPVFPAFGGDAAAYALAMTGYVGVLMNLAAPAVASATGIYNILFRDVFGQISDKITA